MDPDESLSARLEPFKGVAKPQRTAALPRRRTWFLVAGVVAGTAVLGAYAYWPSEKAPMPVLESGVPKAPVSVEVAERSTVLRTVRGTGRVAEWARVVVSASSPGVVTKLSVQEGGRIQRGSELAQLRSGDARRALEEAQAEVFAAQVEYSLATSGNEVVGPLAAAPDSGVAGTVGEILSGRRREEVLGVRSGLTQARQKEAQARDALRGLSVRSPVGGIAYDVEVLVGQRVSEGDPMLSVLDVSRVRVEAAMLEDDFVSVRVGQAATVRIPSLDGDTFRGRVIGLSPVIDPETGAGTVEIEVSNEGGQLMPGMYAEVEVDAEAYEGRIFMPAASVVVRDDRDVVFVVEGGRASWRYVVLGAREAGLVEVTKGLAVGDSVAVAGHLNLARDTPVQTLERSEGQPSPR